MTSYPAKPGHNKPPVSKEDFIAAIEHWTQTRRVAEALSVEEFKELESGVRLAGLARFQLDFVGHWLRENPGKSAIVGVLMAVCALSDVGNGYCNMSQERIGRFFGRTRKHINECIEELKRLDLIRDLGSVNGNTCNLIPNAPRIFFEEGMQTLWLFDVIAPPKNGKPGRKPKIPVTATVTPISEIPVTVCGDTYSEIPVTENRNTCNRKRVTQISFESPVVEEEGYTPRANGCASEGSQERVASPAEHNDHAQTCLEAGSPLQRRGIELSSCPALPSKEPPLAPPHAQVVENTVIAEKLNGQNSQGEALNGQVQPGFKTRAAEIDWRWGYSPTAEPKRALSWKQAQRFLNFANDCRAEFPDRLVNRAVGMILNSMETDIENEPKPESKPGNALKYFQEALHKKLRTLRSEEHADQASAKAFEAKMEIDVNGARRADDMKLGALGTRLEAGNQATMKRIEGGASYANGRANGKHAAMPAQSDRFRDDEKKVEDVLGTWITGFHANEILDRVPGATTAQVRRALLAVHKEIEPQKEKNGFVKKPEPEEIIKEAARLVLFDVHGTPEKRCGGHAAEIDGWEYQFSAKWLCFSQEFIDGIKGRFNAVSGNSLGNTFWKVHRALTPPKEAEGYLTLQERAQASFERLVADEHKEQEERNARNAKLQAEWEARRRENSRNIDGVDPLDMVF